MSNPTTFAAPTIANHQPRTGAPASDARRRGASQGWLTPGVRLFGNLRFPAKAACIAAAFLMPLAMALVFLVMAATEQIDFARSERAGLTLVRPALQLVDAAQDRRRSATANDPDLADAQSKVKAAFDALRARQAELAKSFSLDKRLAALEQKHNSLLATPRAADADETFKAHSDYIALVLDFVRATADASQLSLDPDLDTYHMMNMSVLRGPLETENTARLRGLGTLILKTKELTPQRRDQVTRFHAVAEYLADDVENSYQQGVVPFPEAAKAMDMKSVDEATAAFMKAAEKQFLGSELVGEASTFLALGNDAVAKQLAMGKAAMNLLDSRLQVRIERLQRDLLVELLGTAACLLLAAYLMLSFYRVMRDGLQAVSEHLDRISQGDLSAGTQPLGTDESAQLMKALDRMQDALRRVVSTVRDGSTHVQSASHEIASASQDLSQRTERAASNLEETAASMEQISGTVKQTSDTAAGAIVIAKDNAQVATRGGEVIGKMVQTMDAIRVSSNRIGEIIGVIDGIAFQTNILALNAAVEAARAGEQGRGFAVVASEVRALAGRSGAAAKEIKTLISKSIEQVQQGAQVAADAGATITEIVANAERMAGLMNEIATASHEQRSGVSQVSVAVQDLDQTTQQNAALVEQTAAAASTLSDHARRLAEEIGFFKVA